MLFTKQERKVLIFIFACLFTGIIISYFLKINPSQKTPPLSDEEKKFFFVQKIDINSADFSQLIAIPGIGPSLAEAILEYRNKKGPIREITQLLEIKGIGPKKLQEIAKYIIIK